MRLNHLLLWLLLTMSAGSSWASSSTSDTSTPQSALPAIWQIGVVLARPYAQFDASGRWLQGANVEVMNQIAGSLKVRLVWHTYTSPQALDDALRRNQIDLAPGLLQTPQGLKHWLFSEPYLRVPNKVVGLRIPGLRSVDLESLPFSAHVALAGPGPLARFMASSYPALQLLEESDDRAALLAVARGQANYAVVDEAQLAGLLREAPFVQMAVVGDSGYTRLLRIAVRKDHPEWLDHIDARLQQMPGSYFSQVYARWMLPNYPALSETPGFWRDISVLMALIVIGALLDAMWHARERRALALRLDLANQELERQQEAVDAMRLPQFSLDHSTVGILWVNWDSRVLYANLAARQLLAANAPGDVLGHPIADYYPSLSVDHWRDLWNRLRGAETMANFEAECRRQDGRGLPVDVALSFLRFGLTEYLVVFFNDASERYRARAELQESEARLQGMAANVPGLVFRLERAAADAPVQLAFLSEAAHGLLGQAPDRLRRHLRQLPAWVSPEHRAGFLASWRRAEDANSVWTWQGCIRGTDGVERWIDLKTTRRIFDDGRVVWDGIAWDITDNKRTELSLAESRQSLRELSAHLESVREEEKARIAREVHDELGQMLTVLRLEMSMCEMGFAHLDRKLQERLFNMKRLIEQTFQIVRDVASALRPPILDAGIASAVEWQVRRFEARTQIPCLVSVPEQPVALSDSKAIGLFRILQEALTNVMRHADAHSVHLLLECQNTCLSLRISDDGRGFDPLASRAGVSFGLVGIRERVLLLGGTLEIDSHPGQGTTLRVSVPLDERESS